MLSNSERTPRFGGIYRLLHVRRAIQARNISSRLQAKGTGLVSFTRGSLGFPPASVGFLLGFFFEAEDGSDVPPKYRALSELRGVASQNVLFINTVVRTSYLA
jgi:hypothetical protein